MMNHHPIVLKVFLQLSVSQTGILSGALGIITGGLSTEEIGKESGPGELVIISELAY